MMLTWMFFSGPLFASPSSGHKATAHDIVATSGIDGGVVVFVGLDDPDRLAGMQIDDSYVVHGLDTDPGKVALAREKIAAAGKYGKISVAQFDGKTLPYVDDLLNLIVVRSADSSLHNEIHRVLAPRGISIVGGKEKIKALPADIDEWTHYLHNPSNNAVSRDKRVAPPRQLQWLAGPRYSRHHDNMSSVSSVVTAGGKVFTIIDEGPRWSIVVPPQWVLCARDAFNGKLLWKRQIATWSDHLFRLKSGPASLPRRLVAVGDSVYTTLGLDAPVEQINAHTGKTIQQYKGTKGTTEILLDAGVLYLVCGALPDQKAWYTEGMRKLMAVQADTGKMLWEKPKWVVPDTLTVQGEQLYFYEKDKVSCLDISTGQSLWQSEAIPRPKTYHSRFAPTLVATDKVVLIAGGEASAVGAWSTKGAKDTLTALDSATGKKRWAAHHPDSGYASPEDVFVIDGKVWFGDSRDGAKPGNTYGLDLMTGDVKVSFAPDRDIYFFHHRCYRGKATENWLLTSRAGIEFIDFRQQHWEVNHWIRGACLYGIVPANGMIYAPQHPCACYLESKMDGFSATAPAGGPRLPNRLPPRLEKGPAYSSGSGATVVKADDWPVYRHDSQRSGSSPTKLGAGLASAFTIDIGGKLSSPVVAGTLLLAAAVDKHTVYAYDATTGKPKWHYIAGARIDSAPTLHGQRVLFGARDGYVYCLRASDGKLAWRFRVGPIDERLLSYEQLESVWPVHGSMLVRDDVVYAVAGRSMFLDGGLRMVRLHAASGRLLSETIMDGQVKVDGKDHQDYITWLNMPVAKPDILSHVGDRIYMRSQAFDLDGSRLPLKAKAWSGHPDHGKPEPDQDSAHNHLFSPTGFLDSSAWHRSYWMFGSDFYSGWNGYPTAGTVTPAGKIMVFDDNNVYGFGRQPRYWRWTTPMEFHFFAASRAMVGKFKLSPPKRNGKANKEDAKPNDNRGYLWSKNYPVLARAMCKAGDTLYVAGPRDVLNEHKVDPDQAKAQVEHWQGQNGSVLLALSAQDGSQKASYTLDAVPAFDGLIAARTRLYMTSTDGKIVCLKTN